MTSLERHNPRLSFRPSTREDIENLSGPDKLGFTARAITFLVDGTPSGIGGVQYVRHGFLAFCSISKDVIISKASIVRCGLEVMNMIKSIGAYPVYAIPDVEKKNAERFLKSMGFEPYPGEERFYIWTR